MKKVRLAACAVALSVGGLSPLGLSPAAADTASSAAASAFGINLDLADMAVIDRAGLAESGLPPGGDDLSDLVNVPLNPVVETGASRGQATTNAESTIASLLDERQQAVPGPYNARAVGQVDDLGVLLQVGTPVPDVNLELGALTADTVRAEAVGVCRAGRAVYSGQSEFVNLELNGQPLNLDTPLTGLLQTINTLLEPLQQVADIALNQVAVSDQGVVVNALRVTVLDAIPDPDSPGSLIPDPEQAEAVLDLIVGQAQVGGLQCSEAPECSNTRDDDGDGRIDAQDPGCINNGVYDPNDDDERDLPRTAAVDTGGALPRTGGDSSTTIPLAGGLAALALGGLVLRRRSQATR